MPFPSTRERRTLTGNSTDVTYTWEGDGYATIRSAGTRLSLRDFSYIADVVGTPKSQRVKPVLQQKASYRGRSLQPFVADHFLKVVFADGLLPWTFPGNLFGSEYVSVPHSARVQASGRAFTAFSDRFPEKISAAEFLQGMQQLSELIPKAYASVTRTIASGYLTKKFGWDNLLSDLRTLATSIDSIRERMEHLKRTYGKPVKLYYRENMFHTKEPWVVLDEAERGFGLRFTLIGYRADYTAGCTLIQELSHIDDFIGWLRAIVISSGLNNPLKALWQTSRLSFVVDWFVDVSGHLDRLASIQPAEQWDVGNISSSVVWTARIQVDQVNQDLYETPSQEIPLGILTLKQYERSVGLPVDLTVFTPSTCTPDQLVLMLAMAGSK